VTDALRDPGKKQVPLTALGVTIYREATRRVYAAWPGLDAARSTSSVLVQV
jgi:hypothetical protein